jgi:hypothetical protein
MGEEKAARLATRQAAALSALRQLTQRGAHPVQVYRLCSDLYTTYRRQQSSKIRYLCDGTDDCFESTNPPTLLPPPLCPLHCNENPIYVFTEKEWCGLNPNFHIHVSVNDLYIPRIGPHIFLQQNRQTDCGNI